MTQDIEKIKKESTSTQIDISHILRNYFSTGMEREIIELTLKKHQFTKSAKSTQEQIIAIQRNSSSPFSYDETRIIITIKQNKLKDIKGFIFRKFL